MHFRNRWVSFSSCPQRRHIHLLVAPVLSVSKFPSEPCYAASFVHCAAWCIHLSSQGIFQFTVHRMRPLFSHSSLPPLSLDVAASNFNNTAHYSYFYPSPRLTMCKPVQLCLVPSLISLLNSPLSVFQPPIHNTALLIRLSHFFTTARYFSSELRIFSILLCLPSSLSPAFLQNYSCTQSTISTPIYSPRFHPIW